ncbi:MAG: S1 RNA-binding domain-containing protein [Myxococcota bacterium]|nr:S1 RNA-binding domain-containing protein [Myxococcota bacterium]
MRKPPVRSPEQQAASHVPVHRPPGAARGDGPPIAVAVLDGGESFAELFEQSLKSPNGRRAVARRDPEVGELVQGEVVQIGNEYAFLDIGAKAEALVSLDELRDESGQLTIQIGDKVEGHVVAVGGKEGGIFMSGKLQRGAGLRDQLQMAYEQGIPVEGLVTGVNKGGLDVDLGGVRAFLPASQIELRYCQEPSSYVGRSLTLRVMRFEDDGRNVVVSRRAILEVEQRALAEKTREKLVPGAVFNGVVTSVRDYGAFVDIGGLEGLVPISELGYGRGLRPEEAVRPGQRVEVAVLHVEEVEGGVPKITLSLKALMADPMEEMLNKLREGDRVTGKVRRLEPFGAFVELQPGVEGLIHISAMAERHVSHPREVLNLGDEVTATVISLDRTRRRIGLSLVEELRKAQAAAAATLTVGEVVDVTVDRVESQGLIVRVAAPSAEGVPARGLIPNSELNVSRSADLRRLFPAGKTLRALVQAIEDDGMVRLSVRAAEMKEERERVAAYSSAEAEAAGKATLGEMLRSKLGQTEALLRLPQEIEPSTAAQPQVQAEPSTAAQPTDGETKRTRARKAQASKAEVPTEAATPSKPRTARAKKASKTAP